jgi:hypothetical protein
MASSSSMISTQVLFEKLYTDMVADVKGSNKLLRAKVKKGTRDVSTKQLAEDFRNRLTTNKLVVLVNQTTEPSFKNLELIPGLKLATVLDTLPSSDIVQIRKYLLRMIVISEIDEKDDKAFKLVTDAFRSLEETSTLPKDIELSDIVKHALNELQLCQDEIQKSMPDVAGLEGMLAGTKIGALAKEISESIDVKSLGLDKPENLDIGSLFGPNSPLAGLIGTVGGKIQDKLKSGAIKQEDLLSEALGMLNSTNMNSLLTPDLLKAVTGMVGGTGTRK